MIQEQQHQIIAPLLKSYYACLIFTIISIQAALSFVIPIYTGTNILIWLTLASCILVVHLVGTYWFYLSLKNLGLQRPSMIALYALIPLGNIPCVVELFKAVNARIEEIGATREMSLANVKAIEADIQENYT